MILAGKKALVTGSSRGIGKAITAKFLQEGATVWGICTKPSVAKEELEELAKANNTTFYELCANASNAEAWAETIKKVLEESGGLDILVNNAGITRDGLSFRMKMEDWNAVINVNLTAAFVVWYINRYEKDPRSLTFAVGRDSRITGESIADTVKQALTDAGVSVLDCGMASTPAMFMTTMN